MLLGEFALFRHKWLQIQLREARAQRIEKLCDAIVCSNICGGAHEEHVEIDVARKDLIIVRLDSSVQNRVGGYFQVTLLETVPPRCVTSPLR